MATNSSSSPTTSTYKWKTKRGPKTTLSPSEICCPSFRSFPSPQFCAYSVSIVQLSHATFPGTTICRFWDFPLSRVVVTRRRRRCRRYRRRLRRRCRPPPRRPPPPPSPRSPKRVLRAAPPTCSRASPNFAGSRRASPLRPKMEWKAHPVEHRCPDALPKAAERRLLCRYERNNWSLV